jgi:hypothetical protein
MASRFVSVLLVTVTCAAVPQAARAQGDPDECAPFVLNGATLQCTATGPLRSQLRTATFIAGSPAAGQALAQLIGIEVATAPYGSAAGGFTFTWNKAERQFVRTSTTFGPMFSERALTLGRGKFSSGFNYVHRGYDQLSGHSLDNFSAFEFFGGSLAVTSSTLEMQVQSDTVAAFARYGVTNNFEVGAVVPYVHVSMKGVSSLFGSTGDELQRVSFGRSSSGIGDVGLFGKYRLWDWKPRNSTSTAASLERNAGMAVAATIRLPTGDDAELLGLGRGRTLLSFISSATVGRFSPHASIGYDFWSSQVDIPRDFQDTASLSIKDDLQYTAGVEYQQHPQLTLLFDLIGRYQRGGGEVGYQPFRFPTNRLNVAGAEALVAIPGGFNTLIVAPGAKWNFYGQMLLSGTVLITATQAGLRDVVTPIVGLDVAF